MVTMTCVGGHRRSFIFWTKTQELPKVLPSEALSQFTFLRMTWQDYLGFILERDMRIDHIQYCLFL